MSDTDGKKTLGLRGGGRSGQVKQSFSHGRTKSVAVEVKGRKRLVVPKPDAAKSGGGKPGVAGDPKKRPAGISDAELERRMKALAAAKAREAEEAKAREAEDKKREEERERRRAEVEAKEREEREREEALKRPRRRRCPPQTRRRRAASAHQPQAEGRGAQSPHKLRTPAAAEGRGRQDTEPGRRQARRPRATRRRPQAGPRPWARGKRAAIDDGRRSGKLTVNQALAGR